MLQSTFEVQEKTLDPLLVIGVRMKGRCGDQYASEIAGAQVMIPVITGGLGAAAARSTRASKPTPDHLE